MTDSGGIAYASWITLGDSLAAELMARAGFDWLILDCQHGNVHESNILPLLQAVALGGARALVRVRDNDAGLIMRALDLGADGVLVPMVSSPEEARRAAQAMRYPPEGLRSFGPMRQRTAAAPSGTAPICLVMIETAEAVENLAAIADTPGVDGLFIGPIDLAISLGHGPAFEPPPEVMSVIGDAAAACRNGDIICGAAATSAEVAQRMRALGATLLTLGSDAGFVRRGAVAEVADVKKREANSQA